MGGTGNDNYRGMLVMPNAAAADLEEDDAAGMLVVPFAAQSRDRWQPGRRWATASCLSLCAVATLWMVCGGDSSVVGIQPRTADHAAPAGVLELAQAPPTEAALRVGKKVIITEKGLSTTGHTGTLVAFDEVGKPKVRMDDDGDIIVFYLSDISIIGASSSEISYLVAVVGANVCPSGFQKLTEAQCKIAVGALQFNSIDVQDRPDLPGGCWKAWGDDEANFNQNVGSSAAGRSPICIKSPAPTPTPMPQPTPQSTPATKAVLRVGNKVNVTGSGLSTTGQLGTLRAFDEVGNPQVRMHDGDIINFYRSDISIVNEASRSAAVDIFVLYEHSNAYPNHGAEEMESRPVHGLDAVGCAQSCAQDPSCGCATFCTQDTGYGIKKGDCWKRSNCEPTKFERGDRTAPFSVYVQERSPPAAAVTVSPPVSIDIFVLYEHSNAYLNHGAEEINFPTVHGLDAVACARHCADDPLCGCATLCTQDMGNGIKKGDCWKRSSCNPARFESDAGNNSFSVLNRDPSPALPQVPIE